MGILPHGWFSTAAVETVRVSDGKETPLGKTEWNSLFQMAWIPDGSGMITEGSLAHDPVGHNSQVWEISYPGGELRKVTNDLNFYLDASMTGDGSKLVTIQTAFTSALWLMPADISKLAMASPHEISTGTGPSQGYMGAAWTSKDDILFGYYSSGQIGLTKISPTTGESHDLNASLAGGIGPSACDATGYFVFVSRRGLMRADDDGGNLTQLTSNREDVFPACSPDGKSVFYDHMANGQTRLWRVGGDGQGATQVSDKSYIMPAISPDGKRVAVLDWADMPHLELMILDARSGTVQSIYRVHHPMNVTQGQTRMAWTPDGRAVVYIVNDSTSNVSNLWEQVVAPAVSARVEDKAGPAENPDTSKQITKFNSLLIWSLAFSPDGKQLVLARGLPTSDAVMISNFH